MNRRPPGGRTGWTSIRATVAATALALGVVASAREQPVSTPGTEQRTLEIEMIVRRTIADLFDVDASVIDLERPLSAAPLELDDLDVVELVIELELRLGVEITDEEIARLAGAPQEDAWRRLTGAMLVAAASGSPR